MRLSTKGRYAVTALADMAARGVDDDGELVLAALSEISERQDISLAYLEQLFAKLRREGLVVSVRGPGGGYRLSRPATEIRISEVMAAVDETLDAADCSGKVGQGCGGDRSACLTHDLWAQLSAQVYLFLHGVTLQDVIDGRLAPCNALPTFKAMLEEDGLVSAGQPAGDRAPVA